MFNYLAADNAGQTAESKHTGSMIFPLFFLVVYTISWLRTHNDMYWDDGLSKTEEKILPTCLDFVTRGSFCIDHFNF